jgi:hypothetical protein
MMLEACDRAVAALGRFTGLVDMLVILYLKTMVISL